MKKLDPLYTRLREEAIQRILDGYSEWDERIDSTKDDRLGITLLFRPAPVIRQNIRCFLDEALRVAPGQYAYPETDMHVTVLSIISCHSGFDLSRLHIPDYVDLVQHSLRGIQTFDYAFRGLTASPSCLMVQGYFEYNTLNAIRERLRQAFANSALHHSIDSRYRTESGHSTVFRLRKPLLDPFAYVDLLRMNRERDFGNFRVGELELVLNDWYQRKAASRTLFRFVLD